MSFDKTKVMRSAERFLSQGKIRQAIGEYKKIIENDPKDYSTLNILGDLHIKNSDKTAAVGCYTQVAEHYSHQGFSHKAISVYNKISRLQPSSMEISAKLAQLYQAKGSVAEARTHYNALAENYQRKGQKLEALAVWKQIAELDPNNTEIYLKIAEVCWQEEQFDEAAESFTEAGLRFLNQKDYEAALKTFNKSLEVKKNYLRALNGLIKAQIGAGYSDEAAETLENILKEQPFNRDILYLLADCYIDMDSPAEAERTVVKLVEQEPANYPKFLELVKLYLKNNDLDSAARILSLSAEHLLVGGQAEEFLAWTNEILAKNPEQILALRLLIRFHDWQRNTAELKESLERLAETAHLIEAFEDERYALVRLVTIAPYETDYARRLKEVNAAHGFETVEMPIENTENYSVEEKPAEIPQFESFAGTSDDSGGQADSDADDSYGYGAYDYSSVDSDSFADRANDENDNSNAFKEFNPSRIDSRQTSVESQIKTTDFAFAANESNGAIDSTDTLRLQKEIESIEFYIEQGYTDLARKSLLELEAEFGNRYELETLRSKIDNSAGQDRENQSLEKELKQVGGSNGNAKSSRTFESLGSLSDEFDVVVDEASDDTDQDDYETHYHMAIAYKEMGLMEDSIREFQAALNFVKIDDGTRRFFHCANLLGHCFMEKQMPKLAITWFKRGLETPNLDGEEERALYYELGSAYESGGDREKAIECFERLYAEDVDYRNVSSRLDALKEVEQLA